MSMGDLYYGQESSIEMIGGGGKNTKAMVVTRSVHPKNLSSFTKSFCGGSSIASSMNIVDFTGRPFGFSFLLPMQIPEKD